MHGLVTAFFQRAASSASTLVRVVAARHSSLAEAMAKR
jgi:hypothetical protein